MPCTDTAPMPLSSDALVAFAVVHVSVEISPDVMALGSAESVQVGAGGGGGAVTVAWHVAVCVCEPLVTVTVASFVPAVPYVFETDADEPERPSVPDQL